MIGITSFVYPKLAARTIEAIFDLLLHRSIPLIGGRHEPDQDPLGLGVCGKHRDPRLHLGRDPVDCLAARLPAAAWRAVGHAAWLAGLLPAGILLVVVRL